MPGAVEARSDQAQMVWPGAVGLLVLAQLDGDVPTLNKRSSRRRVEFDNDGVPLDVEAEDGKLTLGATER